MPSELPGLAPLVWRKWKPLPLQRRKTQSRPMEERFWECVRRAGPDECWEWTRRVKPYGQISLGRRGGPQIYSHRASWMIHHGEIPEGLHVLHKCDNGACVNPAHLFLGTQADNNKDCLQKGRASKPPVLRGNDHPRQARKLTDAQVLEIRASTEPTRVLVARYGMSTSGINFIRARQRWQHLGE